MLEYCIDIFDNIVEGFSRNITWQVMFTTYWFLTFVEFPRYYLLEIFVVCWRKLTYRRIQRRRDNARYRLFAEKPLVSILVPGKNEGPHIYNLARSLREQTYTNYEIIIVDDGSDDNTPLICADLQRAGYIDRFLRTDVRGGKASAANFGLRFARGRYIVHLDADTSLDRDAIENILLPFYSENDVRAVGGAVKVRNADETICTSLQALEYLKTIQVGRMVTNSVGILHIISGAFGAFDRDTLLEVGGWDIGPGLDGDITQKIRKAGYRISFAENAIAMTHVPTSWRALYRQRQRWSKSLVRFRLRKHRDILLPYGNFSFTNLISNLEGIMYDFVFNFIWVVYFILLILEHPDRIAEIFAVGYIIRFLFNLVAFSIIMLVSERASEEKHLIKYVPLSTFYTGYFLRLARLTAHIKEIFFFSSYKDQWNPSKTSEVAHVESI